VVICPAAMAIATAGIADAATASGITCAAIITVAKKNAPPFVFVIPLPGRQANAGDANGRARAARPVLPSLKCNNPQPNPISTAMRIRSEWFFAPSFCLSSEVVLATVL
jgi:hypothetical protein